MDGVCDVDEEGVVVWGTAVTETPEERFTFVIEEVAGEEEEVGREVCMDGGSLSVVCDPCVESNLDLFAALAIEGPAAVDTATELGIDDGAVAAS